MNPLRKARNDLKLTQPEAAKAIGISYSMLSKVEAGNKKPSFDTIEKIVTFYGKSADELFFYTDQSRRVNEQPKEVS